MVVQKKNDLILILLQRSENFFQKFWSILFTPENITRQMPIMCVRTCKTSETHISCLVREKTTLDLQSFSRKQ